ncbi:AAA family ATPase [Lutimaribacter sp. EGI FJ00015]|uniref:AAA family ATPase n=1 Tax=Lutimaribacter degradans TaxID=2945989 RepID=A0ACC5ZZ31_9RHOB|nr:AAA family ATPase [Lutimaribacter sp. EGI FJ00013]MCO0614567.1 AAA family ATPase [Lutimaribacter sp. EGI FJ00015]
MIASDSGTIDTLETLRRDRVAARQKWTFVKGGLPEAVNRYKSHPSPDLIIFQSDDDRENLQQHVAALAQVSDNQTRAIVIGRENDVGLFRMLQQSGVSDYLTRPLDAGLVADAIRANFSDLEHQRKARISAFIGLSGGCGSSSMAQNVAVALGEKSTKTVMLADCDLQGGTVKLNFDHQGTAGINELIRRADRADHVDATLIERLAFRRSDTLHLLTCEPHLEFDRDLPEAVVDHLLGLAMHSHYHLVLDLPRHLSPQIRNILRLADDVVLTVPPDLVGLRNFRLALEHLSDIRGKNHPPLLILNEKGMKGRAEVPVSEFVKAVGETRFFSLPFDPRGFSDAITKGSPLFETSKKAVYRRVFNGIAQQLGGGVAMPEPLGARLWRTLKKWW